MLIKLKISIDGGSLPMRHLKTSRCDCGIVGKCCDRQLETHFIEVSEWVLSEMASPAEIMTSLIAY